MFTKISPATPKQKLVGASAVRPILLTGGERWNVKMKEQKMKVGVEKKVFFHVQM